MLQNSIFLLSSNFNREFRRVTGMNPTEWRAKRTARPAEAAELAQMVDDRLATS
jgi:AraC-like DNA-binding protein